MYRWFLRMDSEFILELKDIGRTYHHQSGQQVQALQKISLNIKRGSLTVIIGPSGSGKSTLIKTAGLLEKPTQGSVVFQGMETRDLSPGERAKLIRRHIGFILGYSSLIPYLTLLENVMLPMINSDTEKAKNILRNVGLTELKKYPEQISSLKKQRVALARALINQPPIILCDEPTGKLGSGSTRKFMDLFGNLKDDLTVIIASNNDLLASYADNLFYIKDGVLKKGK